MNTRQTPVHEAIRKALAARYPSFPVSIMESPDDRQVLCVRVFAVPTDKTREVKSAIRQIEQEVVAGGEYLLLPMVKDPDVTRQYYPEFAPPAPSVSVESLVEQFFLETVSQGSVWQPLTHGVTYAADHRESLVRYGFDMGRSTGEQLRPTRASENEASANAELALAA